MNSLISAVAGVANACEVTPCLITGGQPTAAHLKALKAAGAEVILDVRDPMEPRPFDEPAEARALGLEYLNIPVVSGAVDDELLERVLDAIRRNRDRPMYFHCNSGNRVGGTLVAWFILDRGMTEEEATEQAMRLGLRTPEMLEWGLEYARKKREG